MFTRRRIDENIFLKWSPKMAYLLGQFKAGANLQKKYDGLHISTTNLAHLIKVQNLLASDHKIYFDSKIKDRYKNGSARYSFHFRNKAILGDLKRRGFVAVEDVSAKNSAPFPEDIPDKLIPDYVRGFFDERCSIFFDKKAPVLKIHYASGDFLEQVSDLLNNKINTPKRKIHKHSNRESYYMKYNGFEQGRAIFNFLYLFVPEGLFCLEKHLQFCSVMGYQKDYSSIDINTDIETLFIIHEICSKNNIDPNLIINSKIKDFVLFCQEKGALPRELDELVLQGGKVAAKFGYSIDSNLTGLFFKKLFLS